MRRRMLLVPMLLVLAVLPGATPGAAEPGPGYFATANVSWVGNIPLNADSAGARLHGGYLYVTDDRGLTIYDVSEPELPVPVGVLPMPQQAYLVEEDVDTNGKILLIGTFGDLTDSLPGLNRVMVIDVRNKSMPSLLSVVDGANAHTISCVADCTYAYGSNGKMIDLRNPAAPVVLPGRWYDGTTVRDSHDVTEVAPGRVVTSSNPVLLLDTTNPAKPKQIGIGRTGDTRYLHGNLWPRQAKDKWLLVGGETPGDCNATDAGGFQVFDATKGHPDAENNRPMGEFKLVDTFRLPTGLPTDGNSPYDQYCAHWFDTHPSYADGGLVAMGWYEHGTRFLDVNKTTGKITERGWFVPVGGSTSAAYWANDEIVYVLDYQRGLDILRFDRTVAPGGGTFVAADREFLSSVPRAPAPAALGAGGRFLAPPPL